MLIAHQCCHQLRAVKTGYPLNSITWPYRGLRCPPIEVEYFFEVILWQVTSFQMIAGLVYFLKNSYEICCVHVTIASPYQDFDFKLTSDARLVRSRDGHALRPILSTLKLVHFDSWSRQSFVWTCDIFNCPFPLDVQNEIQLLSRVFCYSRMASLFIDFLVERCFPCQSSKSDFGWHRFRFSPCLMRKRVQKSQSILA